MPDRMPAITDACLNCDGKGRVMADGFRFTCPACEGDGKHSTVERLALDEDEDDETRCWVTLRIAVDVPTAGERPTDEEVREALSDALDEYILDDDHITWGVEGEDEET